MCETTAIKLFIPLLIAVGLLPKPGPPPDPPVVTVLCYHTFDSRKVTPYTIDHQRLNEEMRYLSVQHIPVIPLAQLSDYLNGRGTLPDRSVVITIDDGYKSAKTVAWPILQSYGFPFTIFIYSGAISRHGSALTWADVKEMADAGVDVESHTLTHPLLTHPGKPMTKADYTRWLDRELVQPKKDIEAHTHIPVRALAYPYGGYSEYVVERVRLAGYDSAFTCDDGDVGNGVEPLHINRRLVFRQTTLREFSQKFNERPIRVADLEPRDGERVGAVPQEIRARLLDLDQIDKSKAKVLVDKVSGHWKTASIDAKGWLVVKPVISVKHGFFFVSLSAPDRKKPGLEHETSWLFIVKNPSKK